MPLNAGSRFDWTIVFFSSARRVCAIAKISTRPMSVYSTMFLRTVAEIFERARYLNLFVEGNPKAKGKASPGESWPLGSLISPSLSHSLFFPFLLFSLTYAH